MTHSFRYVETGLIRYFYIQARLALMLHLGLSDIIVQLFDWTFNL